MRALDAAALATPHDERLGGLRGVGAGAVALAAALPILFLHVDYQPSASVAVGPLSLTLKLQDAAMALVVLAAVATAIRSGLRPLRSGAPVWLTWLLFLAWSLAACFYPLLSARGYAWKHHLVTLGEFWEYALLAPALPLLLRRRADAVLVAGALVAWSVLATLVGIVQYFGWSGLGGWGRGFRQPSFLGPHDFASLSGMVLGLGLVTLLWRLESRRLGRLAWLAVASGVVGFVVGGASAGIVGLVPATVVAVAVAARRGLLRRRTLVAALGATTIASVGVLALRAGDFDQFLRFAGVQRATAATSQNIQSYSQRTLLAYIGLRIWLHHPAIGVGWEGSGDPAAFEPELPAAHHRFPDVAPQAFPSPQHTYGVQLLYVQVLADLGVVGFVLLVALFAAGLAVGLRAALRAPPAAAFAATLGVFWLVLVLGLWTAMGLVAGVPLDVVTWSAFGVACLGAARMSPDRLQPAA